MTSRSPSHPQGGPYRTLTLNRGSCYLQNMTDQALRQRDNPIDDGWTVYDTSTVPLSGRHQLSSIAPTCDR